MSSIRERVIELHGESALRRSAMNIRGGAGVFERVLSGKGYRTVLEIGTYRGVSSAEIAQYCERVVTIDLHQGRLEQLGENFDRYEFWKSLGIDNIDLRLIHGDREKKRLIDSLDFDFAFVDGAHDESVRNDFELVKRCGRVLFHDADDNRLRPGKEHHSNHVFDFLATLPKEQLEFIDIFALWTAPEIS